jgi:hypothetical protein
MMKRILTLAFFAFTLSNQASASTTSVIVTPTTIYVTADEHMDAVYVTIELLDANGLVKGRSVTSAGSTVSFQNSQGNEFIRSTFHMSDGQDFIIFSDDNP